MGDMNHFEMLNPIVESQLQKCRIQVFKGFHPSRFRLCPCESLHTFLFEQLSHPPTWHHAKLHETVPVLVPMPHVCLVGSCVFLQQWLNLEWKIPLEKASVPDRYSAHHGMGQTLKPTGLHLEHQMTFHGRTSWPQRKKERKKWNIK